MLLHLRSGVVMVFAFTLLTGVIYPLAITGVAWVMMQDAALGSLVEKDGKVVGSRLVGQGFTTEKYFHPRPSATGPAYNAAASTGSNLGPLTQKLLDRVRNSLDELRIEGVTGPVPVDAVTTSSSGLDPDISPETAMQQVARVAKARGLPEDRVRMLVGSHIEGRALGFLGEPHVNVLNLNLALDALSK
jgi:K+-transporting ATPase ATPase C chain